MVFKMNTQLVQLSGQKAFTTSLIICEEFSRQVTRVHEKIESGIDNENKEIMRFSKCNFALRNYIDSRGKSQKYYEITEDGFLELAMSFTGDKARLIRIRFISAFREAIDEINRLYANPPRSEILDSKRKTHDSMMLEYVDFRAELGKITTENHFMSENKLCNSIITGKFSAIDEKSLSNADAELLGKVRTMNENLLKARISYDERKKMLQQFGIRHRTKLLN